MATCCWCRGPLVIGQVLEKRVWLCPGCFQRQVARAVVFTPKGKERTCLNVPLPSQVLFEECPAKNILWGGQAGPGKSHGVRWWLYKRSLTVQGHKALLLRETYPELLRTHLRDMATEVPLLGGKFTQGPPAVAYFPATNAYIDCGHMADSDAVKQYLSTNYGAIVAEEGSTYPLDEHGVSPLGELSTRAREVFRDGRGDPVRPVFLVVSNPGGPSSPWLLDFFIDHAPDFDVYPALRKVYRAEDWAYIPARLDDNPYQDPEYESVTLAVLPKWRYEQLRHGDWRVFAGQFFSQWRGDHHVRDLGTPSGVRWFRSLDWGYNQPGAVIWWAVLPDGRLYIRDDWKFQTLDEPDVAKGIFEVDRTHGVKKVSYTAADPSIQNRTGATHRAKGFVGRSIQQTLAHYKVPTTLADNDRPQGWKRCHALLRDAPDGVPWVVLHPDARYLVRSIPAARSSKADPDDVDTAMDDHALDAWRYGAMSPANPLLKTTPEAPKDGTIGALKRQWAAGQQALGILARRPA